MEVNEAGPICCGFVMEDSLERCPGISGDLILRERLPLFVFLISLVVIAVMTESD